MSTPFLRAFIFSGLAVMLIRPTALAAASPAAAVPAIRPAAANPPDAKTPDAAKAGGEKTADSAGKKDEKKDDLKDFDEVTKDAAKIEGLFTFYRKKDKLYLELKPEQLDHDYLITITQESGIGMRGLYDGMPLQDYLFRFRRVNDELLFVQRNVWFRAKPGQPVNRSLERAFTDSVLASLKLESIHKERKSLLVDAAPLFMADLPGLASTLKEALGAPYSLDASKTYYGRVKSFPLNAELETYYSFNSPDPKELVTVPDARNLTLRVHYSLSALPDDDYQPRLADDRVGYFLTAYQDFSSDENVSPFVRYINRWNLQKKDPDAPLSEPKKPIVFWLENTIPLEYRDAIRAAILQWNVAFEKAGFKDAIVVKQQPDDADWDAADVRYSTIRWINSIDAAFAMGPSRVNPLTGEILDADIVIDANFLRSIKQEYRVQTLPAVAQVYGLPSSLKGLPYTNDLLSMIGAPGLPVIAPAAVSTWERALSHGLCLAGPAMAQEARFGMTALALRDGLTPDGAVSKEYLDQFLGWMVAHEVGHTLGLRHNFHGSTLLPLSQINNRAVVAEKGMYGSVMDYIPANIAPNRAEQGYYYSPRVGPYDVWAIQYGYTPITAATPEGEVPALRQIAQRSTEPDLAYATDEDAYDLGAPTSIDPTAMIYDQSGEPIAFAVQRMSLAKSLLLRLARRGPGEGNSYADFRRDFGSLMGAYDDAGYFLSKWIGGEYFSRSHAGDPGERLPMTPVPAAKQREALNAIRQYILAENAFQFSPDTLNKLAPSRWWHWAQNPSSVIDFPVLEMIESLQWNAIARLYHPIVLRRLLDSELKVKSPAEALTLPELFTGLTNTLWSEVLAKPARNIPAARRAIQRDQLDRMVAMVVRPEPGTPDDARSLARAEIHRLQGAIHQALAPTPAKTRPLDAYTRAHLEDADARITKALAAPLLTQ